MENKRLNMILKFIGKDTITDVEKYIEEILSRKYIEFENEEEIKKFFINDLENIYENNPYNSIEALRYYTGIAYREVNQILRNKWDYETSGNLTEEKKASVIKITNAINSVMLNNKELNYNIKAFRGVSLSSFKDYGISSLEELINLKGQYYFESAFTSTSLLRDKSFFNRSLEWHENCNIEIEYLIPMEATDGIPLIDNNLSYSNSQSEFLLNNDSLSKIIDVNIVDGKAYIKMAYIPKKIWDLSYKNYIEKNNKEK